MKTATCKSCNVKFIVNKNRKGLYCSPECHWKGQIKSIAINCKNCNNIIYRAPSGLDGQNVFCNHVCAANYNNILRKINGYKPSTESRDKISNTLKNRNNDKFNIEISLGLRNPITREKIYKNKCIICNIYFERSYIAKTCSKKCYEILRPSIGRIGGLKSASLPFQVRSRSKNERLLFDLIKHKFSDAIPNKRMFNGFDADIIIPSLKLAIHWNGAWHYTNVLKGERGHIKLLQVQNKDKLQLKEIENCGYKNYIIKDMAGYNPEFVKSEFDKLLVVMENFEISTPPL